MDITKIRFKIPKIKNGRLLNIIRLFATILFFTLLTRAINGISVARVSTSVPITDVIQELIEDRGVIEYKEKARIQLTPGIKILECYYNTGDYVEKDTPLLIYDLKYIKKVIRSNALEIEKIDAEISQNSLDPIYDANMIQLAEIRYNNAIEDMEYSSEQNYVAIERALEDYEFSLQQYERERRSHRNTVNDYDDSLSDAESDIDDKRKEVHNLDTQFQKAKEEYTLYAELINADDFESEEAKAYAYENMEAALTRMEEFRGLLDSALADLASLDDTFNDMLKNAKGVRNDTSGIITAMQSVVQAERQLQDMRSRSYRDDVISARTIYEQQLNMDTISLAHENHLLDAQYRKKVNEIDASISTMQAEILRDEINVLQAVVENEGIIMSTLSGIMIEQPYLIGEVIPEHGYIEIDNAESGYVINLMLDERQSLNIESAQEITVKTLKDTHLASISSIQKSSSDSMTKVVIELPTNDFKYNQNATVRIIKRSETYDMCVPIEALHNDNNGYFVYVVEERSNILGIENVVVRVPVSLVEEGDTLAAVEGPLNEADNVITKSNKIISEGDKVRLL